MAKRISWIERILGSPEADDEALQGNQLRSGEYRSGELSAAEEERTRAWVQEHWSPGEEELVDRWSLRTCAAGAVMPVLSFLLLWAVGVVEPSNEWFRSAKDAAAGVAAPIETVVFLSFLALVLTGVLGGMVGLLLGAAPVRLVAEKRALKSTLEGKRAAKMMRVRNVMRERLTEDPLGWPSWTLKDEYPLLNQEARAALEAHAGTIEFEAVLADARGFEGDEEQTPIRDVLIRARERGVARVDSVTLRVPVTGEAGQGEKNVELARRHRLLSETYGAYLSDPREVLRRPALSDVSDPRTAEFVEAFAALTALSVESAAYEAALERAWKSWRAADAHSRRLGLKGLTREDRKRMVTAQRLLEMALDPGATDSERAAAYSQVEKLLEGLVQLPQEAQLALSGAQRVLTAWG